MSGRSRMDQHHGELSAIPALDAVGFVRTGEGDVELMQPLGDSVEIVLEPVGHKDGFPVGGFNQVLQSVQLPIM